MLHVGGTSHTDRGLPTDLVVSCIYFTIREKLSQYTSVSYMRLGVSKQIFAGWISRKFRGIFREFSFEEKGLMCAATRATYR